MSKSIKVGVIGCGMIGNVHMQNVQEAGGQLAAVCDVVPAKAQAAAKKFNCPNVFTDYRKMLKSADLDAVTIGLPNNLHCPATLAALAAGKHVMCEKPMAMNVGECAKMTAAAAKARRVLQIGLVNRYYAEPRLARQLVADGRLGEVYHAVAFATRRRGVPGRGGWFTTKNRSGGGPLIDIGVHILDLTTWMMGQPRPVAVCATTYQKFIHRDDYTCTGMWSQPVPGGPTNVEDYVTAMIRFANGATVTLECSWAANLPANAWHSQLLGDRGGLLVEPGGKLVLSGQDGKLLTDTTPVYKKTDPFLEEFKAFLNCCATGKRPPVPPEHGHYTQAMLDGIYRSAAAGKEVAIKASDLPKRM